MFSSIGRFLFTFFKKLPIEKFTNNFWNELINFALQFVVKQLPESHCQLSIAGVVARHDGEKFDARYSNTGYYSNGSINFDERFR